ncbi:hypothetical protein C2R66_08075 [Helicobacter pylori]|uniref:hypothetical protein n=1 Tax=Helicobacter pylori TaxID=210 RepID=UPI000D3C2C14|nr:hypothetical protein [Helicobacter pylori]PUD49291.1 hypothetical protein C2R66_08075 [Helicobacter pylori]
MTTVNAIRWPKKWVPGETDNFVSNEVIVKGLDFKKVVQHLMASVPNAMLNGHQAWLDGLVAYSR